MNRALCGVEERTYTHAPSRVLGLSFGRCATSPRRYIWQGETTADPIRCPEGCGTRSATADPEQAAERRPEAEQRKAGHVQRLASGDLRQTRERRHRGREAEHVAEGDPAHRIERGVECAPERRQSVLHDARIDLADEGADADGADDEPRLVAAALEEPRGGRFGQFKTADQRKLRGDTRQRIHAILGPQQSPVRERRLRHGRPGAEDLGDGAARLGHVGEGSYSKCLRLRKLWQTVLFCVLSETLCSLRRRKK